MPQTEQCVLGAENKTRIDGLGKAVDRIESAVDKITNHFSQRPTRALLITVSIFTGLLGTSVGVNVALALFILKQAI